MILKLLLFTLIFIGSYGVYSQELRGRFLEYNDSLEYASGDLFKASVVIWPTQIPLEEFDKLRGTIGAELYLVRINDIARSENNMDAVVINGDFILREGFQGGGVVSQSFLSNEIVWELPSINFVGGYVDDAEYEYAHQAFFSRKSIWLPAFISVVFLLFFYKLYIRRRNIKRREAEFRKEKDYWIKVIGDASTRKDYEYIEESVEMWEKYFDETKEFSGFSDFIRTIQYKKEWSSEEQNKIDELANKLKSELIR